MTWCHLAEVWAPAQVVSEKSVAQIAAEWIQRLPAASVLAVEMKGAWTAFSVPLGIHGASGDAVLGDW